MVEEILRHCEAGRLVAISAPAGMGKSYFLQHELRPALETRGLGHVQVIDQFEDCLRTHSTGLFNPQVIAIDERALPQLELLEWNAVVLPLPVKDIVAGVCRSNGFEIEEGPLRALREFPGTLFMRHAALRRLMDAERTRKSLTICQATLDNFGGVERLVLETMDGAIAELNAVHCELFFRWCSLWISPEGRRVARAEKELTEYAGKWNRFALTGLPHMMELGLIRPLEMPGETRYEIARECMTPMIRDWWRRRESDLIAKRRARFRVRSLSVAVGSIVTLYVVWILMTWKR